MDARTILIALTLFITGCGKSFVEADAIAKDEVQKLKALEAAILDEVDAAIKPELIKIGNERNAQTGRIFWSPDSDFLKGFSGMGLVDEFINTNRFDEKTGPFRPDLIRARMQNIRDAIIAKHEPAAKEQAAKVEKALKDREAAKN